MRFRCSSGSAKGLEADFGCITGSLLCDLTFNGQLPFQPADQPDVVRAGWSARLRLRLPGCEFVENRSSTNGTLLEAKCPPFLIHPRQVEITAGSCATTKIVRQFPSPGRKPQRRQPQLRVALTGCTRVRLVATRSPSDRPTDIPGTFSASNACPTLARRCRE
jgi:hypothetical protein